VKIVKDAIFGAKKAAVAHANHIPGHKFPKGSYSAFVPAPVSTESDIAQECGIGRHGQGSCALPPMMDDKSQSPIYHRADEG
jgi:hypothetical protein